MPADGLAKILGKSVLTLALILTFFPERRNSRSPFLVLRMIIRKFSRANSSEDGERFSFSVGRLELLGKQRKEFGETEGPLGRTRGTE